MFVRKRVQFNQIQIKLAWQLRKKKLSEFAEQTLWIAIDCFDIQKQ